MYFLKFYGLKGFISNNKKQDFDGMDNDCSDIIITIDDTNKLKKNVTHEKKSLLYNKFIRYPLNSIYMIYVFMIISWMFIYSIAQSIIEQDGRYFTSNIFALMYIMQFITGIIFYRKDFYGDAMKIIKEHHIKLLILYIVILILSTLAAT